MVAVLCNATIACSLPPAPPAASALSVVRPEPASSSEVSSAPRDGTKQTRPTDSAISSTGSETTPLRSPGAQTPTGLVRDPGLFDPGGNALQRFYSALRQLELGKRSHVRLAFFGASHVASDLFTNVVRHRMQQRFGNAGPGFVWNGKPFRWHRHARLEYRRTRGFEMRKVFARAPKADAYGLSGLALAAGTKLRGMSAIQTRTPSDLRGGVTDIELYYQERPNGGRVRVLIDGKGAAMVRTRGARSAPAYRKFKVDAQEHLIELRTQADGPVRIFGMALENQGPGVVLDTLGIPGARARNQLLWNQTVFAEHLKRRDPALVVLAYGTNESGDDDVPIAAYERRLHKVLDRVLKTVPEASCLLIGPSDRPIRDKEAGTLEDRPRTRLLIASQQKVAAARGCAFFDLLALMGGPMSMPRWVAAKPRLGAPDHVHFTARGYQKVGELLHSNLMQGYVSPAQGNGIESDSNDTANPPPSRSRRPTPSSQSQSANALSNAL